ncbi:MAG: hypothetical protein AAGC53_03725 [Actinomycetota bacterium]
MPNIDDGSTAWGEMIPFELDPRLGNVAVDNVYEAMFKWASRTDVCFIERARTSLPSDFIRFE